MRKDYIEVSNIGRIKCKPDVSATDARIICEIGEEIPFVKDEDTGKAKYLPEYYRLGILSSMLVVLTDYDFKERDLWLDMHETDLYDEIMKYYNNYFDDILFGYSERVKTIVDGLKPVNDGIMFDSIAKQLENVDVGTLLATAQAISSMDEKEIVKAASETIIP